MTTIKISRMQYFFLIPNILFSKSIGITVGIIVRKIGGDTWTAMAMGMLVGIILMLLIVYICSKFPDKTIINYSEDILGKWISKIIGIVLSVFFAIAFATSANVMTLHLKQYFLIDTPFLLICLAYTLLCMYGAFLGVEVIIRFSLLGFLGALLINITMITGTIGDFEANNLLPLLDQGLAANMINSIYIFTDLTMAIMAAGILYSMLNKKENVILITFWSMILSALMIIIWPVLEIGVMGAGSMKQFVVVCMQQIRCAQLTRYLPRYELVMVSFFTFSTFVQSAIMFFCSVYSIKQTLGIKKDIWIISILALILTIITYLLAEDDNNYILFLTYPWAQICAILGFGLPVILLFTALIRGKLRN